MPDRGPVNVVHTHGIISVLASFPVIVFAYTCHQNVSSLRSKSSPANKPLQMFSILNEIKDNSPFRTTGVVTASIGTAASIYILVAITGYLSFGDNVYGNIIAQYHPSVASTIGRAAIVVLVMFSYPLQVHPCRASVDAVSKWRPTSMRRQESSPASSPTGSGFLSQHNKSTSRAKPEDMSELRFAIITTLIIILSYLVAMTVSSLDKVLAYVGSTGSTSISFILPGLFYYKISSPDSPHHQRLIKDEDDEDFEASDDPTVDASSEHGLVSGWRAAFDRLTRGKPSNRILIRRLSLALAIYGLVVMVVCLIINTFTHVAH